MGISPMLAAQNLKRDLDIECASLSQVANTGETPVPQNTLAENGVPPNDVWPYNRRMTVRPATIDDVAGVVPMVRKIAAFHQSLDAARYAAREDVGDMYRSWLTDRARDPRSVFLVAGQHAGAPDALAGFLIATVEKEIPIYLLREFGLIHDLWVEEEYRNEGLARQMVTLAIERFTQLGVSQIRLHAAWANAPARTLFERCGFRAASVEMLLELESAT
jgi:ribosomal protein S18 acetylase RimI-like enzyme